MIQVTERIVPRLTMQVEIIMARWLIRPSPKMSNPKKLASNRKAVSTSMAMSTPMIGPTS